MTEIRINVMFCWAHFIQHVNITTFCDVGFFVPFVNSHSQTRRNEIGHHFRGIPLRICYAMLLNFTCNSTKYKKRIKKSPFFQFNLGFEQNMNASKLLPSLALIFLIAQVIANSDCDLKLCVNWSE